MSTWNETTAPNKFGQCWLTATCKCCDRWLVIRLELNEPPEDGGQPAYVVSEHLATMEEAETVAARLAGALQ